MNLPMTPISPRILKRRTFLERLGLGAGAILLAPVAESLVSEAHGQTPARKRAIFFLHGNGLSYDASFTPAEFRAPNMGVPVLDGPKAFTWPRMFKALEPWRARMLLVDGLPNHPRSGANQHGTGFSALSCFAAANGGSNEGNGQPGNITIDQFIANTLGANTRAKSVLFGASTRPDGIYARTFAAGPEKGEPHFQSPRLMFNDLFGSLVTDPSGLNRGAYKQRLLLDNLRGDLKRLETVLAGIERRKLDHYVAAIEDFEKRMKAISSASCQTPPFVDRGSTVEDRLEAMNEMATLALTCGMTNVAGVSVGCGDSHTQFPKFTRLHAGTRFEADGGIGSHGHSPPEVLGAAWDILHNFHGGLIARTITALQGIKEGDKTAFDNSVILYTSDNGGEHHSKHNRYPLALIGDAGGKLKSDGRFIRYPAKGQKGARSMGDLFCTIATACGVPTYTFGKGGNEPVQGPLGEILG